MAIMQQVAPGYIGEKIRYTEGVDRDGTVRDYARSFYLTKMYVGATLSTWERNGYHDSDFGVVVWDDTIGGPSKIETWSTRGACPDWMRYETVDATPEVLEKLRQWQINQQQKALKAQRKASAAALRSVRASMREIAVRYNVPYLGLLRLRKLPEFERILALFNPKRRSAFMLSMRAQVVKWIADPKYDHPLSKKQREYLPRLGEQRRRRYNPNY